MCVLHACTFTGFHPTSKPVYYGHACEWHTAAPFHSILRSSSDIHVYVVFHADPERAAVLFSHLYPSFRFSREASHLHPDSERNLWTVEWMVNWLHLRSAILPLLAVKVLHSVMSHVHQFKHTLTVYTVVVKEATMQGANLVTETLWWGPRTLQ